MTGERQRGVKFYRQIGREEAPGVKGCLSILHSLHLLLVITENILLTTVSFCEILSHKHMHLYAHSPIHVHVHTTYKTKLPLPVC